jgi:hypothetical protein
MPIEPSLRIYLPAEMVALDALGDLVAPGTRATNWRASGHRPAALGGRVLTGVAWEAEFAVLSGRPNAGRLRLGCEAWALDLRGAEFEIWVRGQGGGWALPVRRLGGARDKHAACWSGLLLLW